MECTGIRTVHLLETVVSKVILRISSEICTRIAFLFSSRTPDFLPTVYRFYYRFWVEPHTFIVSVDCIKNMKNGSSAGSLAKAQAFLGNSIEQGFATFL